MPDKRSSLFLFLMMIALSLVPLRLTAGLVVVPLEPGESWKFIEVSLPVSGSVTVISNDGVHDGVGRTIKWGPLSPELPAVLFQLEDALAGDTVSVNASPAAAVAADSIVLPVDVDGDGIPGSVETRLGLSDTDASDSKADLDGDGIDNLTEYLAGTNPEDRDSLPVLRRVLWDDAGNLLIELSGGRLDTVKVESTIRLDAPDWQAFTSWEIMAAAEEGGLLKLQVPNAERAPRYFRLRWGY